MRRAGLALGCLLALALAGGGGYQAGRESAPPPPAGCASVRAAVHDGNPALTPEQVAAIAAAARPGC